MVRPLKLSTVYFPTLKEEPVEAEVISHKLLLRAAMMRKTAAGVYSFLPLGFSVLHKIEQIIREEEVAIGSQEILMPALQPEELWMESGRWNDYGPELMRLRDRHDHGFCLGPTHEELITSLIRNELRSYKELPKSLFQIQSKYRDEIRPRFGLLRSREFIMKDAYSFHASQESLQEHYDQQGYAYGRMCDRMGLTWRAVDADSGQIGGKVTSEFMALADSGECELVYCSCDFAADTEMAEVKVVPQCIDHAFEKVSTPGVGTIADLAVFLDVPEAATVKALAGVGDDGIPTVMFIPGDHELNELKSNRAVPGFLFFTDDELVEQGLVKGFMGPVGLPEGVRVVADASLKDVPTWIVGANEVDYHFMGARNGEDFQVDVWADLVTAKAGDLCPVCGKPLETARGIEVSQIFQLGTKYSEAMGATYHDENGEEKPFIMGCYGVGVTRSLAAIVEQHNDEHGIIWPISVAPAEVCILPLTVGDEVVEPAAAALADALAAKGVEVVIDDRDERAGVKFNDADLLGWPYQVTVGKRGLESGTVEFKVRATGEKKDIPLDQAADLLASVVEEERKKFL